MRERTRRAAYKYIENRGWTVLEPDWRGFTAFEDGGHLVFAQVIARRGKLLAGHCSRSRFEDAVFAWLEGRNEKSRPVRFDEISLNVCADGERALLRHTTDAMLR